MTLEYQILGNPGRDNVLYVRLDSGSGIRTFLFDCGEGCLSNLSYSQLQAVEHLFFSHFHMDHVCGFDSFFRCNYNRSDDSVNVWGPIGSASILQHRFQGYWWNIKGEETGTWFVNELQSDCIVSSRFELKDAFEEKHEGLVREKNALIIDEPNYTVSSTVDGKLWAFVDVVFPGGAGYSDLMVLPNGNLGGAFQRTLYESGVEGGGYDIAYASLKLSPETRKAASLGSH